MPIQILQLESTTTDGVELKAMSVYQNQRATITLPQRFWWRLNGGASPLTHKSH